MDSRFIIKCPHCGAEYLLEEILMGDDLLGSRLATKDSSGHIVYVDGDDPEMSSEYICDFCDKRFVVNVDMTTTTVEDEDLWEEEYKVEIFKDRIELAE